MPSTPNWNIPYPCSGATIDCTVFRLFTEAIQTAITELDMFSGDILNRPAASINGSGQSITVAVLTNATFTDELYDNSAMANLAVNNDRLTITENGLYMVTAASLLQGTFTTISSNSVAISNNGTVLYRRKNSSDGATNVAMSVEVTGLVNCVAGDVIRMPLLWTGTGGPDFTFDSTLSARLVTI